MNNFDTPYILIIDDTISIQEALHWFLENEGYHIVTARNGQEALSIIEKNSIPRMIFLDLMMPIMSGFQFREMYKEIPGLSNIPTAIISARRESDLPIKLLPNEIFLKKPFDFNTLLGFIKTHWPLE